MESIEKFRNYKIENIQEIYGGTQSVNTYPNGDASYPRCDIDYYQDGCKYPYKTVVNPGFWNWLTGDRQVVTMADGCGSTGDNN